MKVDYKQLVEFFDPILMEVVEDIEDQFGEKIATSLYRIHDDGVHHTLPLRAIDFHELNMIVGYVIAGYINSRWSYDFERPELKVCKFHDTGSGFHLHVQVHPNTKRR